MESLHREMDRLFEGMWSEGIGSSLLPEVWARGEIMPQLDMTEDDKAFSVKIDLPGLDEEDVEVTLSDGLLTVCGEK
jgi:HSP20 family protein